MQYVEGIKIQVIRTFAEQELLDQRRKSFLEILRLELDGNPAVQSCHMQVET